MNWVSRKIYLYNVTIGLYVLDWWERLIINILVLALMWFICYNITHVASHLYQSHFDNMIMHGASFGGKNTSHTLMR